MPAVEQTIGPYEIDAAIGQGAFGTVYRAHHHDTPDTAVAIKVVEGSDNLDRLLLEPALLAKLDHPGIVGLRDYFVDANRLVLALEFVPGEDLKACVDRGDRFSPGQVRE